MYLGEEGGPDGLNVGDLGGGDESLELLGLWYSKVRMRCRNIEDPTSFVGVRVR